MLFELRENSIDVSRKTSNSFPYHLHTHVEILVCTKGSIHAICSNQEKILFENDVMICFPNEIHAYKETVDGDAIMIIFDPNISEVILSTLNSGTYKNFIYNEEVTTLVKELLTLFQNGTNYPVIYGYLHIIFGKVLEKRECNHPMISVNAFDVAIRYISNNYTKQITLAKTSQKAGVSQEHLSRVFSEKIDGGFTNYLRMLRVEKAKKLLEFSELKIYEIMFESGFVDQRTFNRVFKSVTGMTPGEYRAYVTSKKNADCIL
ncbi:MAG: helix-turn-helix transcriptional regulator [Ruminococcaceae bacterium]|nr:helix-turn-helix transcriptional regulator [Oscillospiraceae bacterium]